jgi:hypothetical protein
MAIVRIKLVTAFGMLRPVRYLRPGGIGLLLAILVAVLFPALALAHEPRDLGPYHVLVGWINEPSIQGEPNAISILITNRANGQPVVGAEKTLRVEAAVGGEAPRTLTLDPSDDVQGLYTASMIPTKVGTYTFTFVGSIGSQKVNSSFQSGPNTFPDVTSPTTEEFPVQVPAAADLAAQTQAANATAQAALQRATLLGVAGIAVGLVGVILAALALALRARPGWAPSLADEEPARPDAGS